MGDNGQSSPAAYERPAPVERKTDDPLPPLRVTIVGSGTILALDRPVIIGRSPALPRIPSGIRPRLLRVPSPGSEISGSHLEIRQVGLTAVATDLRSTNGSVIRLPGQSAVVLRSGESMAVSPGTLIALAEAIVVEILPREYLGAQSARQ